ncbi:leucine-rich repeat protein [Sodaliphilus sp.]|uniref:leucine-rich repeat domain-containing protein n=1 Tax=Sodaliphilus sp. TaxID=2815818 RepID=UPI00388D3B66
MNKIKKLLLGFGLMALTIPAAAIERDADGYYLIGSTADYEEFCNLVNTGDCYASARVTADGVVVTRSLGEGEREHFFRGKFDGQGHTMTITNVPLFEHTEPGSVISNVNLTGNLTATGEYAGSLIAHAVSPTIENCNSDVVINAAGASKAGGLVGYSMGTATINNSSFSGQITGTEECAGLVGWNQHTAIVKGCHATGTQSLAGNLVEGANIVENTLLNDTEVAMRVEAKEVAKERVDSISNAMMAKAKVKPDAISVNNATIDGITYTLVTDVPDYGNIAAVADVSSSLASVKVPANVEWNGNTYSVITISGMPSGKNVGYLEVPSTVIRIDNDAFKNCTNLELLYFLDGTEVLDLGYNEYTFIDEQLFENCPLFKVYIGRNLSWNKNEDEPFETRNKLKYIEFGPRVTVVGNYDSGSDGENQLFNDCDNVEKYYFYGDEQSLGTEVTFYCSEGMSDASAAYISRDLKASKYTEYTEAGTGWGICDRLQEVYYGPFATYVTEKMYRGYGAAANAYLTTVSFKEATRLTTVRESAFEDCDHLQSDIDFSNTSLKTIEKGAFFDCFSLENVTFSPTLETIGKQAFQETKIKNISLPGTLKRLGYKAFHDCDNATTLSFSPGEGIVWCDMEDDRCNTFTSCENLTSLYLGRDIYWTNEGKLKGSPFYDSYFTNVVIDDNVYHLGNFLFQHSNKLQALSIGKKVKEIPNECFNETKEIQSFILTDSKEPITLGNSCANFKVRSLYMGRPIEDIENIPGGRVDDTKAMELLQVGPCVSEIKSLSFTNYHNLKTVTLPANITVKSEAFYTCGIQELYVQGDAHFETQSFSDCYKLSDITVIGKLTLDDYAFYLRNNPTVGIQNVNVFFKEDPKDESSAIAFPKGTLENATLNNLYDTPYQQVEFTCLPWSGFQKRNTHIANDYVPSSEAMTNDWYDHAYARNEHDAGKYFTVYLPFDVDTYYFGPEATVYSFMAKNTFITTVHDGELTYNADVKYNIDSNTNFGTNVPFLIKSEYKDDIIQATMDQFKNRQVNVYFSHNGTELSRVPCYASDKDEVINPSMGNYYVVDNGCLKKVNGDYLLPALSVALKASAYSKLHFTDNGTGEPLMPDNALVTPLPDLMGYATFYSSESSFSVENAEVYTISQTYDNDGHALLKLDHISDNIVNQGQGVLIKYEPGMTLDMQMVTNPSACTEAYENNVLKGVDVDTPIADLGDVYVLSKVEKTVGFFPYAGVAGLKDEDIIPANRAYISPMDVDPEALPAIVDYDTPTVINGINADGKQSRLYDLSGRRVFNPEQGGIYIKDGKKIIQK